MGDYPTSLNGWMFNLERHSLMDYVLTHDVFLLLVLTPQAPKIDMDLFIRPFQNGAWAGVVSMVFVLIVAMVVPYFYSPISFEETATLKIISVTAMFFFILINAYYGGAMTMFFTSEISIPFEGIRDVIRDDSWNLMIRTGWWD